jgi:hypothetical protein
MAWIINGFIKKAFVSDVESQQFLIIRDFLIEKCTEYMKADLDGPVPFEVG